MKGRFFKVYSVNFDKYFKLLNWNVIFWGIKGDIIEADCATDYANVLVKNGVTDNETLVVSLLILEDVCKDEVLALIANAITDCDLREYESLRILRYIILDSIKELSEGNNAVLNAVENVYADFDYPSDMDSFISYMPADDEYDASKHTQEENEQRLIKKLNLFLKKETQWIKKIHSAH